MPFSARRGGSANLIFHDRGRLCTALQLFAGPDGLPGLLYHWRDPADGRLRARRLTDLYHSRGIDGTD